MSDFLWYKNAVLYEMHVRAFFDSNGDGIGDFRGLTQKLDYLQDLGVTALWLLPFYPSPLKDDGYDIADYYGVHPLYGTLADFRKFLREAHRRGLKVVTELVLNHTSDQHPWFQRARRARPGSAEREFYVWSNATRRYGQARIIFKDFESSNWTWDPVAKAYYWHRFYSHQPDLNYDHPAVRTAVLRVADFWLKMGVDGLRLDAVPYLFEREGTSCENLPESHAFLKELRRNVDERFQDRMLLAEANQWPEDARAYFGEGDECHMAFHFPVMPRLFMAIRMEDRFPVVDILEQTPKIPGNCQWALFLRNHDELTLEMVTDEDRDYMVRVYAQDPQARINLGIRRRLAPLLGNNRRKIELMNGLLFSLPGSPVIYYGDEIGMGDNVKLPDRDGVRTPMEWSPARNAGFSEAPARRLYLPPITDPEYHYEVVNVQVQEKNPHSLLWQMRRMIVLRKQHLAFGHGTVEFLKPDNGKILAYVRQFGEERILVVANLSRFVQYVEFNLNRWKGMSPVEMFGGTHFPAIEGPYPLTLGPHAFYWFSLEAPSAAPAVPVEVQTERPLPMLEVQGRWDDLLLSRQSAMLERILPRYLQGQRWFGGKARKIRTVRIVEALPVTRGALRAYLALAEVGYMEGEVETFLLPVGFVPARVAGLKAVDLPHGTIAQVRARNGRGEEEEGILCDALSSKEFCRTLLALIARGRQIQGGRGELAAEPTPLLHKIRESSRQSLDPVPLKAEQSNSSILFGDQWILKLYRNVGEGMNVELEMLRFLSAQGAFTAFPPLGGALTYRSAGSESKTLAILQRFVPNQGDAWTHTLDAVGRYFEEALARPVETSPPKAPSESLMTLAREEIPALAQETIGPYLQSVRTMGERLAQFHGVMADVHGDRRLTPEPFDHLYQRSVYQMMRAGAVQGLQMLRRRQRTFPPELQGEVQRVLRREQKILEVFEPLLEMKINGMRIRCHGDFHLGQVLYTGKDFLLIDFEGEPLRSMGERRIKRSALRDVAGMLRSFHYAADAALFARDAGNPVRPQDQSRLDSWVRFWKAWVCASFLRSYLETASSGSFLPTETEEVRVLLRAYLLEKAMYEVRYEMSHRPEWVRFPLRGVLDLLEEKG